MCTTFFKKSPPKTKTLNPSHKLAIVASKIIAGIHAGEIQTEYSKQNEIQSFPAVYKVNCTGFINHLLVMHFPHAIEEIKSYIVSTNDWQGYQSGLPRCLQYYRFFQDEKHPKKYWQIISNANHLNTGDLIVYCVSTEKVTKTGQHIMLVSGKLKESLDNQWKICPIYDSTRSGHDHEDLRNMNKNGIGRGKIALQIDNYGKLKKLKWSPTNDHCISPKVALARLKYY